MSEAALTTIGMSIASLSMEHYRDVRIAVMNPDRKLRSDYTGLIRATGVRSFLFPIHYK